MATFNVKVTRREAGNAWYINVDAPAGTNNEGVKTAAYAKLAAKGYPTTDMMISNIRESKNN